MKQLSPRTRVENAISHKMVDRIPRDLGGPVSGISKIAYDKLLTYLHYSNNLVQIADRTQQLAEISEKVLQKLKIDTRHIRMSKPSTHLSEDSFRDAFNITYKRVGSSLYPTLYYEMVSYPLEKAQLKEIQDFNWPSPRESWIGNKPDLAKKFYSHDLAVVADPPSGGIFEKTIWLRGMNQFIIDLYENRDIVEELLDQNLENQIEMWTHWLEAVGEWVTVAVYSDDYGTQSRSFLHPNMWQELVKPRIKSLIHVLKRQFPHIKIQLHSCGSVAALIPDFIEIGFDILNPVQPHAMGMDHDLLKQKYGTEICFHGGVDIQEVLPYGTPEEVAKEIERVVHSLANDRTGYIFAFAHNILADVRPENIIRAFEMLEKVG